MQLNKNEIQEIIDNKINDGIKKYGKDFKYFILEILSLEKMLNPEVTSEKEEMIIPLSKWNDYYPFPTVASLRQTYFNRDKNGFGYCVEYGGDNGGRILINVNRYHEWRKSRKPSDSE